MGIFICRIHQKSDCRQRLLQCVCGHPGEMLWLKGVSTVHVWVVIFADSLSIHNKIYSSWKFSCSTKVVRYSFYVVVIVLRTGMCISTGTTIFYFILPFICTQVWYVSTWGTTWPHVKCKHLYYMQSYVPYII